MQDLTNRLKLMRHTLTESPTLHAFVGQDLQGDYCIYIGRLAANFDFDGEYLSPDHLEVICNVLNAQDGWSEGAANTQEVRNGR